MLKGLRNNRGFILIELSIALAILGVLISSSMMAAQSYLRCARTKKTLAHQEIIFQAIKQYVALYHCLPLPEEVSGNDCGGGLGIPPYRQLGLPIHVAKDGCGRWMTYVVDTSLTWRGSYSLEAYIKRFFFAEPSLDIHDTTRASVNAEMHKGNTPTQPINAVAVALVSIDAKKFTPKKEKDHYVQKKEKGYSVDARNTDGVIAQWMTRCQVVGDLRLEHFSKKEEAADRKEEEKEPSEQSIIQWQ